MTDADRIKAITMPKWGMTMTEGTLSGWLVKPGSAVTPGQEIMEVETTKITNVVEATAGGVLRRQVAEPGAVRPVGALLGVLAGPDVPEAEIDAFVEAHASQEAGETDGGVTAAAARVVEAGEHKINVLSLGSGGTPVVLLHGFGGDQGAWLFNAPVFAEKRAVHALDLPAHGASSPTAVSGRVGDLANVVAAALDALGVSRAHLVGHSLGGAVALTLAAAAPDRVASLALVAPVGLGPEIDAGYLRGFVAADRRRSMKELLGRLFANPEAMSASMIEDVLRFKRVDGVPEALSAIAEAALNGDAQALDLRDAARGLQRPVIVLWGEKDAIVPVSQADALGDAATVTILPGVGHMPMMEAASAVNAALEAHFAEAERAA